MGIRRKVMLLLLGIALIPLIGIVLMNRVTLNVIGDKVESNIRIMLEDNAVYNMQDIIQDFDSMFRVNMKLLQSIVELQSIEVEKLIASKNISKFSSTDSTFAFDKNLKRILVDNKDYFYINQSDLKIPFNVDFNRQNYFLVNGVDKKQVIPDMARMSAMTADYHRLFQMEKNLITWMHTSFENGLHLTYPAGSKLPKEFDPIKREWYIGAKNSKRIYISSPYIDASTRNPMLTLSKAVFYPDGSLAGVTGIDFNLTDVFTWLRMNPKWASGAEAMLISREGESNAETLKILARMNYGDITHQWDQPLELESLESPDVEEFAAFKTDMLTGLSGVRLLRYREKQSIWAYRGFKERQVYPLLIVPAENFKSIINETENFLWATNLGFLKYTALLIIIVIVCVIYVSIRRARSFTRPINDLAQAGNHLAEGNFDARVNIKTGDELQQLGEVFNQIGPKLREHQKMQHSLALARAVQQRLLPKQSPKIKNFDMAGLCKYSDETGGDYYDFISFDKIKPGKVSVILGDVTGHGLGSALLMASARSMLRNNIRHYAYDLSKILYEFNNELTDDTDTDKFITLFYGLIDMDKKTLSWATGGHDPAIWFHRETGETENLVSEGVPLGILPDMDFEQAGPVTLKSGDLVVIGTDGIWEAENDKEEMFGKERMLAVINKNKNKSSGEICNAVVEAVLEFCEPQPQDDDITVILIKVL